MKFETILMPTDLSGPGDAAIDLAVTLAKAFNSRLLLVHVIEPDTAYVGSDVFVASGGVDEAGIQKQLSALADTHSDVNIDTRIINGEVTSAILDVANNEKVDLIVMGTHGRSGLTRVLMGSIAESVMRSAPCPVLSYKHLISEKE